MSIDYSSVAGIGIEIYPNDISQKVYGKEWEESDCEYSLCEDFIKDSKAIEFASASDWDDTRYFYFAKDPINGVEMFIHEMIFKGFPISYDDLKFISEVDVC